MSIFVDTAVESEARVAKGLGWVKGITTNPSLLAQVDGAAEEILMGLAELRMGPLFYQVMAPDVNGMVTEARAAAKLIGDSLVLKIPPTAEGFQVVSQLGGEIPCSVTAMFSVAQSVVAAEAGAQYVIVYVNRATRLLGDGIALVRVIANVLKDRPAEILAASLKSSEETSAALQAGAHHLTIPLDVLQTLPFHEFSQEAVNKFNAKGKGI